LKLVIDCFKLVKGAGKSIGIYNLALNLVRELSKDGNRDNCIVVLGNPYNKKDFNIHGIEFIEINKNPLNKVTCILWELFEVSVISRRLGADKVLFPRGYASMLHLTQEYVIIHDMISFYYNENYPSYFNRLENFYIMWRLKASARKADRVITISQASKNDILKYSHTDGERITVIYNGYNPVINISFKEPDSDYMVAVTSSLPHKNAEGIVKSYVEYYRLTKNPLPLTIVGISDISKYEVDENIKRNITCIKYIEKNEDLYQLIYGAKLFLFLSLAEGFGFPPIEAMQLGTPVICSDRSSLPEVVGDGAVLVNPDDYSAVAYKIKEVLDAAFDRKDICERGKINSERFNWNLIGNKYREVLF
jgi:glycosyltransferase involved in cell wall biosynthesis